MFVCLFVCFRPIPVVEQQIVEIEKQNGVINTLEREMLRLKAMYETAVEQRNFAGVQLIDRNDELCVLYEKSNIQETTLTVRLLRSHPLRPRACRRWHTSRVQYHSMIVHIHTCCCNRGSAAHRSPFPRNRDLKSTAVHWLTVSIVWGSCLPAFAFGNECLDGYIISCRVSFERPSFAPGANATVAHRGHSASPPQNSNIWSRNVPRTANRALHD